MLDVAIVGGGVCGLALARRLVGQGRSVALFEARERLGGRVLTTTSEGGGLAMDLGPSWFWPHSQPLMSEAVAEFGLAAFPQNEDGDVLRLADPEAAPERREEERVHEGAFRLEGGMAALVRALAESIPPSVLRLNHALLAVREQADHARLSFAVGDRTIACETRHVVLALPPRLVARDIRFEPDLDAATVEALGATPTWMASRAKAAMAYARPFWREAGHCGSAFVSHEQAVLGEIFDACDAHGRKAALGGFLALDPRQRTSFRDGLPMLIASQVVQVFGPGGDEPEVHYRDWALEPRTCGALDRESPADERADSGNPLARRGLWGGKLLFGGAETAARDAGLLEGALEAAARVERDLLGAWAAPAVAEARPLGLAEVNAASLARFEAWVSAESNAVFDDYRRRLQAGLATQQRDQLTQLALLGAMEALFARALAQLEASSFNAIGVSLEHGRCSLTPRVQAPFRGPMQSIVDDVAAFNRTSCALSNFPDEHRLSKPYLQVILRDIAAAWHEFSLSANRLLLAKAGEPHRDPASRRRTGWKRNLPTPSAR